MITSHGHKVGLTEPSHHSGPTYWTLVYANKSP